MGIKHGPWEIRERVEKYRNSLIKVVEDQVTKPDGKRGTYATVELTPGALVLAVDDDQNLYVTEQFRYALGRNSIEAASGAIDEGESPEQAATRELREELGIEADEMVSLGMTDPDTSTIHGPANLFLARKLRFTEPEREGSEVMRTVKLPLEKAVRMVIDSEITHGASCVAIMKAEYYLNGKR